MTENDFLRQVWRANDKVVLTNGETKRVLDLSFRTKSVQVAIEKGVREWFTCDCIEEHLSFTREPDDLAIIADLHNKLMAANKRNDDLQRIVTEQRLKMESWSTGELKKCVNVLINDLREKKKTIERIEKCTDRINELVDKGLGVNVVVLDDESEDIELEERSLIVRALSQFKNEADAANSMCMSLNRMRHRILKYGIKKSECE